MLTSIRGPLAASLSAGLFLSTAPAFANNNENASSLETGSLPVAEHIPISKPSAEADPAYAPLEAESASSLGGESEFSFSGNVAFTTEYRFRGVDLSGGEFAVQGGFDVAHSSGLYVGTWASSLDEDTVGFGSTEIDLYAGWSGDLSGVVSADIGAIWYLYPDSPLAAGDTSYVELYGSLSFGLGPASLTSGIAYAPDQSSLGSTDNLYLYSDASVAIPDSPLILKGHIGYTDGFLTYTNDSKAIDWSLGADLAAGPVTFTAAYVGVEGDTLLDPNGTFTDDAFVLTVAAEF